MREIHRSALVSYSAAEMFALVNAVEAYPDFLPWCRASSVRELGACEREASLEFSRAGMHRRFTTHNSLDPAHSIRMGLVDGPFRVLEGTWSFRTLGEAGSKVTLDLRFEFASRLLEAVFAPVFAELMNSLVDAFVARARELHHDAARS